ncbi:MAG: LysM peptidoglycan-binding domain-containing protein [Puniceicoccales bacterium]|jgi:LysM repeat protein|nr:LysM peptidoglycan-binding domain-containing protein [Puniceicoccales bacterium]
MEKVLASVVKSGLLLVVLGLVGCATPFGGKTIREPSPEDTIIVREESSKPIPLIPQRIIAPPRRPDPEPEEVLIIEPEVTVSPEIKPIGAEYVVRKGDCLSWIARKFKISLGDLSGVNGLDRNAKLSIGRKLILPGVTQAQVDAMDTTPAEYIIKKGDCLSFIARQYGVSIRELRVANNLKNDRIIAGKKLIIPEHGRYTGRLEKGNDRPAKKKKNFEVDTDGYYTIRKGDFLSTIAAKAQVSVRDLQNWNNISDPARIRVGERILVKSKTITPADVVRNEPAAIYPAPRAVHDPDFFGTIDEIPVVQVQD